MESASNNTKKFSSNKGESATSVENHQRESASTSITTTKQGQSGVYSAGSVTKKSSGDVDKNTPISSTKRGSTSKGRKRKVSKRKPVPIDEVELAEKLAREPNPKPLTMKTDVNQSVEVARQHPDGKWSINDNFGFAIMMLNKESKELIQRAERFQKVLNELQMQQEMFRELMGMSAPAHQVPAPPPFTPAQPTPPPAVPKSDTPDFNGPHAPVPGKRLACTCGCSAQRACQEFECIHCGPLAIPWGRGVRPGEEIDD